MAQEYDFKSSRRIIAFVGTVGAGKSTQIRLLRARFRKNKVRVKATGLKTNVFLAQALVLFINRLLSIKSRDLYPIKTLIDEKPTLFKKLFKLWLLLDTIGVSIQFILTVYLPMKVGYTVLIEEYIPATIADYIYVSRTINLPLRNLSFTVNLMSKLIQIAPVQLIFLDAKTSELHIRWKRRKSLAEKPDYLEMQRTTLLALSTKFSSNEMLRINTANRTIQQTHTTIVHYLLNN
jgi:thymidylate kinase